MKKSPKVVESEEHAKNLALIQQLNNLEKEWKSLQKSRPRNPHTSLLISDINSIITSCFDHQLLENSPRELMSSLQHKKSPSDGALRVKKRNMAVEEILRDRMAAITTGKLKGRRLFSAAQREPDLNYGGLNTIEEREAIMKANGGGKRSLGGEDDELPVAFSKSCSFSDSLSEEKVVVVEEEKTVVEVANALEKRGGGRRWRSGGWCMAAMAWFAVVLILITLGIVSMICNGKYAEKNVLILVPT